MSSSLFSDIGYPGQGSSSNDSLPSLKRLHHLFLVIYDSAPCPYTLSRSALMSVGVTPNNNQIFMYALCSSTAITDNSVENFNQSRNPTSFQLNIFIPSNNFSSVIFVSVNPAEIKLYTHAKIIVVCELCRYLQYRFQDIINNLPTGVSLLVCLSVLPTILCSYFYPC